MQKIRARIAYITDIDNSHAWVEEFDRCREGKPEDVVEEIVENFNRSRNPRGNEVRRKLVEVLSSTTSESHDWRKSSAVTEIRNHASFDRYVCINCGITGKRVGLSSQITRDHQYRGKRYEKCS